MMNALIAATLCSIVLASAPCCRARLCLRPQEGHRAPAVGDVLTGRSFKRALLCLRVLGLVRPISRSPAGGRRSLPLSSPTRRTWTLICPNRATSIMAARSAVVKPSDAAQVAAVLALCTARGVGVVPQGGNTGLVGGQTPDESGAQIVLSLQKLDRIREVDPASDAMTLEAGVTLAHAQEIAESVDRYFPLSLASEGSCTIGGNLATNAGGVHVLAYGAARDLVLGLEVALADGRLLSTLGKLRKDNTGYDLTQLFIGSEGTLGVITAATLKLFPRPRSRAVAFRRPRRSGAGAGAAQFRQGSRRARPSAFELMPRIGLELVLRHIPGARDPLAAAASLVCARSRSPGFRRERGRGVASATLGAGARRRAVARGRDARRIRSIRRRRSGGCARACRRRKSARAARSSTTSPCRSSAFRLFSTKRARALRRISRRRGRCPSAIWATAICTIMSRSPIGADKAAFLARWDEMNDDRAWPGRRIMRARFPPSTALAG